MDRYTFGRVISETPCIHENGFCTMQQTKEGVISEAECLEAKNAFNKQIDERVAYLQSLDPNAEIQELLNQKK